MFFLPPPPAFDPTGTRSPYILLIPSAANNRLSAFMCAPRSFASSVLLLPGQRAQRMSTGFEKEEEEAVVGVLFLIKRRLFIEGDTFTGVCRGMRRGKMFYIYSL